MSDDLISRKELLEVLNKRLADYSCDSNSGAQRIADIYKYELIPVVENAPTAFYKEKVIEELKKQSNNYYPSIDNYCLSRKAVNLKDALKIVEKGGI